MTKPSFQGVRLKDDGLRRTNTREEEPIRRTTTREDAALLSRNWQTPRRTTAGGNRWGEDPLHELQLTRIPTLIGIHSGAARNFRGP